LRAGGPFGTRHGRVASSFGGNGDAISLLRLRKDSNLTLSAGLWGNVTIKLLLTRLSDSVLAGVGASPLNLSRNGA
jgi:hypothetical protein